MLSTCISWTNETKGNPPKKTVKCWWLFCVWEKKNPYTTWINRPPFSDGLKGKREKNSELQSPPCGKHIYFYCISVGVEHLKSTVSLFCQQFMDENTPNDKRRKNSPDTHKGIIWAPGKRFHGSISRVCGRAPGDIWRLSRNYRKQIRQTKWDNGQCGYSRSGHWLTG